MPHDPTLVRLANATLLVPSRPTRPHVGFWTVGRGHFRCLPVPQQPESAEQITELNAHLAEATDTPLISLDEEGDVTGSDRPTAVSTRATPPSAPWTTPT